MIVYAIAEDGQGCMAMSREMAYTLLTDGGKPGQKYPCVLIEYERTDKDSHGKEILQVGRG